MKASDAALAGNGVGEAERADFLALFERYRDDIVEASERSHNTIGPPF
jgi:hemoglobin